MYGIIFDVDGVLISSFEYHHTSLNRATEELFGLSVSKERFLPEFGKRLRPAIESIWTEKQWSDDDFDRVSSRKDLVYRELCDKGIPIMPGARSCVERLHYEDEFRLAVGSSGQRKNVLVVAKEFDVNGDVFSAIVTGEDVTRGKPDPQVFLRAAEVMGLDPSQCLVVEDAVVGIHAALRGGMKVVALVGTSSSENLVEAGAHRVIERLEDLTPELARELLNHGNIVQHL